MNKIIALSIALFVLSACSSKSLYETGQNYQKNECMKNAATAEQHQACLNEKRQSYRDYQREREEIIEKQ